MSSRARAVLLGRPPGSFLLTKWITCSLRGARPTEAGGRWVCFLARLCSTSEARRWALKPTPTMAERMNLMVSGLVALSMAIASLLPGRKLFLSILRSRLRMFMVTSPKSIFTGQGLKHLWQTVQWSDTSSNSCQWRSDTPRRDWQEFEDVSDHCT